MTEFAIEQVRAERLKGWLTAASILVSAMAAITAYLGTRQSQREQATDAFQLKVAEIVMAARTPWEAKGHANALAACFPDRVRTKMADSFDPESQGWGRESRRELLAVLAAQSDSQQKRKAILNTYKALFPGDKWANDV